MPVVDKNLAIVPVNTITTALNKSIYYAHMIADDVIAVHVSFEIKLIIYLLKKWNKQYPDIRLVTLHSEYRSVIRPISRFIDKINKKESIKTMSSQWLSLNFIP